MFFTAPISAKHTTPEFIVWTSPFLTCRNLTKHVENIGQIFFYAFTQRVAIAA